MTLILNPNKRQVRLQGSKVRKFVRFLFCFCLFVFFFCCCVVMPVNISEDGTMTLILNPNNIKLDYKEARYVCLALFCFLFFFRFVLFFCLFCVAFFFYFVVLYGNSTPHLNRNGDETRKI
jgi:hypothetical protein